jgi:hypothetical protein
VHPPIQGVRPRRGRADAAAGRPQRSGTGRLGLCAAARHRNCESQPPAASAARQSDLFNIPSSPVRVPGGMARSSRLKRDTLLHVFSKGRISQRLHSALVPEPDDLGHEFEDRSPAVISACGTCKSCRPEPPGRLVLVPQWLHVVGRRRGARERCPARIWPLGMRSGSGSASPAICRSASVSCVAGR